jgi:hypothetical protein
MRVQTLLSRRASETASNTSEAHSARRVGTVCRLGGPVAAVLVAAVALTACTSSSDGPSKAAASGASTGTSTALPAPKGATNSAPSEPAPKDTKARPVPHKTVQPPTKGSVKEQVAARKVVTLPPVALDHAARLGNGVTVQLSQVRAMNATARMPGEVAGPAIAVTVKFVNKSAKAMSLDNVVLNVTGSDKSPGNQMSTAPAKPLSGTLAKGTSATGVYVFTLSTKHRDPVTVTAFYSTSAPTAAFVGPVN